ncbi:hypothetical protein ACTHQF_12505 [Pedobacter sp. SAFR-022]|uniref:hypothetical protein n=1 Tax=Pedobacter sp. SAFR-022 TaxID=3436861 RepID=UPI003F809297
MPNSTHPVRTIGGYMGLQLPGGKPYYPDLIQLNTARNSLEYILLTQGYTTIYLPYFTCEVLLEPIKRLQLQYHFYKIDEQMDPVIDFEVDDHSCMLYTNYFGVKTDTVRALSKTQKNLIIDNAQAFYAAPIIGIDTFYSCRKFFGVPDGAYLYARSSRRLELSKDSSVDRMSHLVKAADLNVEAGYADYVRNNDVLINNEIKVMSNLTQQLMAAVEYDDCAKKRREHFAFLHERFKDINEFKFHYSPEDTPMVYPLLIAKDHLKSQLIERKIFVATYWPNVFEWTSPDALEYHFAQHMISLPIDQRYNLDDMKYLVETVESLLVKT